MRIGLLSVIDVPMLGYILKAFEKAEIRVDSIIMDSLTETPKSRHIHEERTGGALPAIPLHEFEGLRIPCFFVQNHSNESTAQLVRSRKIDYLVNAGTPRILKPALLEAPKNGVINCHPGLLPDFRGCTCVEWAIYLDEQVGNTVHFMTAGIDEGPIILSEPLTFGKSDRYVHVRTKVYRHGFELMARGVRKAMEEGLTPSCLPAQCAGRYFKVMEPDKMSEVFEKLEHGRYAFQMEFE